MPSATLVAADISKAYGAQVVLDGVSLTVTPSTRAAIVGPNGVGKSTFLRIIAGLERCDAGRVERAPPEATIGYLPQEKRPRPAETVRAYLARRTGVAEAEREVDELARAMSADPSLAQRYADSLERFVALGGGDLEARAATVCEDVGLEALRLDQPMATLSGGQRARAALAGILLARFDVFLMDEPTNDLDYAGLDRLEAFLGSLDGGVVVVSHDRAFLERTVTEILEIEEGTHSANLYAGGYEAYLERREAERQRAYAEHEAYVDERDDLAERARRVRAWSQKGVARAKRSPDSDKYIRGARIEASEQLASKVKSIERRLERLDPVDKPFEPWDLRLRIGTGGRAGHVVARLRDAVVERGAFTLGPLSIEISWAERVELAGPNGCGKTTLIEAICGGIPLSGGERYLGPSVVVGRMEQDRETFAGEDRLLDVFCEACGFLAEDARTLLAKFGLGASHVLRECRTLSPGERTRATLALFTARGVNLLVLDEPTNHLDLPGISELERALEAYEGTLLLVTHDRRFRDNVRITRTIDVGHIP